MVVGLRPAIERAATVGMRLMIGDVSTRSPFTTPYGSGGVGANREASYCSDGSAAVSKGELRLLGRDYVVRRLEEAAVDVQAEAWLGKDVADVCADDEARGPSLASETNTSIATQSRAAPSTCRTVTVGRGRTRMVMAPTDRNLHAMARILCALAPWRAAGVGSGTARYPARCHRGDAHERTTA